MPAALALGLLAAVTGQQEKNVNLYHFTGLYQLVGRALTKDDVGANMFDIACPGSILEAGLKPGDLNKDYVELLNHPNGRVVLPEGVWLTSDPNANEAAKKLANGGLGIAAYTDCRIEVVIPSRDRRLHHWYRYLLKRGIDLSGINVSIAKTFYIYFGTVLPSAFRAVERTQ